ncbi:MAG: FadR/GntR family transcriptional regulator [Candidatus Dormibacteria bacterium]
MGSVEIVSDAIERAIAERGLGPGSRLPTERELVEITGVGRTAVRRALGYMEAEGRLVRQVGRGTFMKPSSGYAPRESDGGLETSPIEIMTVRALFEPEMLPLAVMAATGADFAEMERCLRGGDSASDYLEWEAWDTALHRSLVIATHNSFLIRIGEMIADARTQPVWGGLKHRNSTEERRELYRSDHRAVVKALTERDPAKAQMAMRSHLQHVRSHLLGSDPHGAFPGQAASTDRGRHVDHLHGPGGPHKSD